MNVRSFLPFFAALVLFISFGHSQESSDHYCNKAHSARNLFNPLLRTNPLTEGYDLKYYRFEWEIDPAVYAISGTATPYFTVLSDGFNQINFDFSNSLIIDSIMYRGQKLNFSQPSNYELSIEMPTILATGSLDSLSITYHGAPPSGGFGSFIQSTHGGEPVLWTLSEPFGSQDWWPCKNGLTDKLDSIDVIVTTPARYRAASNGLLIDEKTLANDKKSYHWKHRYAIAPYLVAIAVTNYNAYTDDVHLSDGTVMPMLNYVYPESESNARIGTAKNVKVLEYFDSLFVSYPFKNEKYGHAQFGWGGGMEHQTMSFVVDYSFGLLSHELAHQWFGDYVTCGSWEDIWLNEGFATYLEGLSRARFPQANNDFNIWLAGKIGSVTSSGSGSVKVDNVTSVNRIFNGRLTYNKGAMLLHMLRERIGDDAFFSAIRMYLGARAFNYATTDQLITHLEAASGQDLTGFFKAWYEGQGFPTYDVRWHQNGSLLRFKINQTTSHPSVDFFEMPIEIKVSGEGQTMTFKLDHRYSGQEFEENMSFNVEKVEFDPQQKITCKYTVTQDVLINNSEQDATKFEIFPNPVHDQLTIIKNNTLPVDYQISNVNGLILKSGNLQNFTNYVDVSTFLPGTYMISVKDQNKVRINKFVKAK